MLLTRSAHEGASTDIRKALLVCGALSSVAYVVTDLAAGMLYPGYSFTAQAVSELFAIGAPTSAIVVPLFTLSSMCLAAFAFGVFYSARGQMAGQLLAMMLAGNSINSLLLWNFFPMHMRGVEPSITDTMHGLLAINPFVPLSVLIAAITFRGWLRLYSIATIALMLLSAMAAFSYLSAVLANEPTPWLGLSERASQYVYQLWQAILALVLLRGEPSARSLPHERRSAA